MCSALVWTLWFCLTVRHISCQGHFENVALNKACKLSSFFGTYQNDGSFAVNNNTDGTYDLYNYINCIHTNPGARNSWWQVDLGRPYPVNSITIWARTVFERRMAYCRITVDDQLCYQFPTTSSNWPRETHVNCTGGVINGRVVRLEKDVSNISSLPFDDETINMCEFQIWSCSARYWDRGCNQVCGNCSGAAPCDKVTGHCDYGCAESGMQPPQCIQACAGGNYGNGCMETCGACVGVPCHHVNGSCQQCAGNHSMPLCKECKAGYYGPDCTDVCGACNSKTPCNGRDGHCDNCEANYKHPLCKDCADGHYGPDCRLSCSDKCESDVCDIDTGHCTCKTGWKPPNCSEAMASIGDCDKAAVAALGSVVAVLGAAVVVLVVVVVIQFRRIRDMQQLLQKAPARPTDMQMESSKTSTKYENTQVLGEAAIEVDLSNYDKLEVYENKKDITNVYTDLTVNKQ